MSKPAALGSKAVVAAAPAASSFLGKSKKSAAKAAAAARVVQQPSASSSADTDEPVQAAPAPVPKKAKKTVAPLAADAAPVGIADDAVQKQKKPRRSAARSRRHIASLIRSYQESTEHLAAYMPFARLVRTLTLDATNELGLEPMRIKYKALLALHSFGEDVVFNVLREANNHRNREGKVKTVMKRHLDEGCRAVAIVRHFRRAPVYDNHPTLDLSAAAKKKKRLAAAAASADNAAE